MHAFDNGDGWLSLRLWLVVVLKTASDYPSSIAGVIGQALVEDCPNGGVVIGYGIDENTNGVLDEDEVDGTETICHGTNGADGQDGAQGPQGGVLVVSKVQGAAGQDGAQGTQGASGAAGQDGAQGPQGAAGQDGAQGAAGQDGTNGTNVEQRWWSSLTKR